MTKTISTKQLILLGASLVLILGMAPNLARSESRESNQAIHQHEGQAARANAGDHEQDDDEHDDHGYGEHLEGQNSTARPSEYEHQEMERENDHHDEGDEHDNHEGHDEHEEGSTSLSPDSAQRMGVVVEQAASAEIAETVSLTGRITLDQNRKADVRARFVGIVRAVKVELGDAVLKGQLLAVVEANESLRDFSIVAPIDGVVLSRNTNVGDVTGDDPLFRIADLSEVWAKFHIFPRDADRIEAGQSVAIHTLEQDKTAAAKIAMLFPTADALSQTLVAIVPLPNSNGIWKPGMTVEGDVAVSSRSASVAVRRTAIQRMEELGDVVFVNEEARFEPRPVKLGRQDEEFVEVLEGLTSGESYVAQGSFIIKSDILKATAAHAH